jgi:predicted CXXCH cytochrome family protein
MLLPLTAGAQQSPIPLERVTYRDVAGKVVDGDSGAPVAGIPVSLLYEITITDDGGRFRFEKVPLTHTAEVSIRVQSKTGLIIGCTTIDVPVRFYPLAAEADGKFAIAIVDPSAEEPITLRLEALPPQRVNQTCGQCHESNPCMEQATFEQVVQSGKDLRGIIVREDRMEETRRQLRQQGLQRETYRKMRYQDTHPDGMNMELIPILELEEYRGRFRKPTNLKLVEDKFVNCDTCHTRHVPTAQKHYVVMPYEQESQLCYECHR